MFLFFCFAFAHKLSLGFDVVGFNGQLTYKKWPPFPIYTLTTKAVDPDEDGDTPDDYIDISLPDLVEAGTQAERSGKSLGLTIVKAKNVTDDIVRKKIETLIGDGNKYRQQVFDKLPYQSNTAFMGGVGITAGYHYPMPLIIFNLRVGVDHMWGTFKQSDFYPSSLARLGWGIKTGIGIDYKLTEKARFGFEGGVRFSTFKNQKNNNLSTTSSWFVAPYVQAICGFYPHPDYGIHAYMGYFFPCRFSINTNGGRIPSGTTCKVDGMYGGLRFSRYF